MSDSRLAFLRSDHSIVMHAARKMRAYPDIHTTLMLRAAGIRRDIAGHKSLRKLGW